MNTPASVTKDVSDSPRHQANAGFPALKAPPADVYLHEADADPGQ
jgi:hypothetical protein